jgi:putative ABC transport system permease protein
MPVGFRLWFDVDIWVPPWPGEADPSSRRYTNWFLVGRLADDVTLDAARSEVALISAQLEDAYQETNQDFALQLDGLLEATVEAYRPSLLLLLGAIFLVLLIACANVANLLMVRGSTRISELAVRAAMGASRLRLARQLLVECVILAVIAGAMGVVLAIWLQQLILSFVSMDLLGIRETGLSVTMLGASLGLSLLTVLFFGLFPSLAGAKANPAIDLKDGRKGGTSTKGNRYRSGLVVFQVAVSLTLLMSSGLLIRSFAKLLGVDPGFREENLLTATVSLPAHRIPTAASAINFLSSLQNEIEALPGVETVGMVNRLPILQPGGNMRVWAQGAPPDVISDAPLAYLRAVLPGYFETMGISLVAGRDFEEADGRGSARVVVLSRGTAQSVFDDESPLGRHIMVDTGAEEATMFEVVGVVEDHMLYSLLGGRSLAAYFPYAQTPRLTMSLAVATADDPTPLIHSIQERIWEVDEDIVLGNPMTMKDVLSNSVAGTRSVTTLLGAFATVATGLAALGLFGVLSYSVTQRKHEIGIRVALGARGSRVVQSVTCRGMLLLGGGSLLGLAGGLGTARLLEGMLFQISPTDIATYGGAVGIFAVVALGACLLPAWRAVRVDPVDAFRAE